MLSRVADSLYWMGRYIERAEHTSRLLAVRLESMVEQSKEDADRAWARLAASLSAEEFSAQSHDAFAITAALSFSRHNPSSLVNSLCFARDNARQVREQLSTEVWEHLNRLYLRLQPVTIEQAQFTVAGLGKNALVRTISVKDPVQLTWHFPVDGRDLVIRFRRVRPPRHHHVFEHLVPLLLGRVQRFPDEG